MTWEGVGALPWLQAAVAVIGVAVGAILNGAISAYRRRIQPVGYSINTLPMFREHHAASGLRPRVILDSGEEVYIAFDNLHIAEIRVINLGNVDFFLARTRWKPRCLIGLGELSPARGDVDRAERWRR